MENSYKPRTSFVDHRRKSLTLNNIFVDVSQEEFRVENPKHSIKTYLESLRKEKRDWKNILKEKKNKCKDFEGQCKETPIIIRGEDVEKFITVEYKEFLKQKPKYLEMLESVRKYIDAVSYLNKYKSDIIDYYDKVYNELEIDKKILVAEMCSRDLCEICNIKNCQRQEHKFIDQQRKKD